MDNRTIETLDNQGMLVDAVRVQSTETIDGEKVTREYVEVYPVGLTDDPEAMIGWYGSVEGFARAYAGATHKNW